MSTCPFVKLRGLARDSKARHKKSKELSRFEIFVWFTVMTIIHFLRTLTALLHTLLIRAGDVELNPGPPPEMIAPPTGENEPSSASTPKDTDQVTPISDEPVHGYTKPLAATSPSDSSANLPVERKLAGLDTAVSKTMPSVGLQLFQTEKEGSQNVVSDFNGAIEHPVPQAEHLKDESKMTGSDITIYKKESDSEAGVGAVPVTTEAVQPAAGDDDDEKTDIVAVSPPRQPRSMKRLSLQRTGTPKPTTSETRKQSREQQQVEVIDLMQVTLDKEPVDDGTEAKRLLNFFVGANKLYRSGEKCPVCPICRKLKKERGGQQKSHVIPKSILHYYWKIHSTSEQTDYILDFSRDERLAAGSLTYQLLCRNCEIYYSVTEEQLLRMYLYLGANPNTDVKITYKEGNAPLWLKYILANILFRGILTNIDLDDHFQQQNIIDEIYSLWKFCSGTLETVSEQFTPPNLKVFLLSNKRFCSTLDDFMYPFEMLLRMPRCTELIQQKEVGTFFYTKFDSFHVVLPLCETSRAYFDTFNNGIMTEGCNLHLRWSAHPKADITRQGKLIRFNYPPECESLKDHFPEVLLKWCTSLYEEFVSRLYNHPRPRRSFLAGIERYRGAEYIGFNIDERMKQADILKCKGLDKRASLSTTFEEQCKLRDKTQLDKYVQTASRHSPLRRREQEELGTTRKKLENKEQELETLKTECIHLSAKVSYQNEKLDIITSDLLSSRAEVTASRSENATLREELASEREINVRHIQIDQERFRKTKFLFMSTLRKDRNHVWLIDHLKKSITDMATDFEYLMEVTQGSSLHQTYEELRDESKKLLVFSPPSSPISTDPEQLEFKN